MSDSTTEALINEYKGNLFEFLVASDLARHFGVEASFLRGLNSSLRTQLSVYEGQLRILDVGLLKSLPVLAAATSGELLPMLPTKVTTIEVIGKISSGERWSEADLVIDSEIPVSLKLCKSGSFVNTKSAGIKSFISKYFECFEGSLDLQGELNQAVEREFGRMGHELYELAGMEFTGEFDQRWSYPDRPGQLPSKMREIVHGCYRALNREIFSIFERLISIDSSRFVAALGPLLGVGSPELIQLTCFYKGDYKPSSISALRLQELHYKGISELKPHLASFEILFDELILQVRVKPMNRFNTPAFKINCSVKKAF